MTQIRVRARLEPRITPSRTAETHADKALLESIYAPLMTTWIGRTERFLAELFVVDALTLCMNDGKAYLEADLQLSVTETSPVFFQFIAWRKGLGQSGRALRDSEAAEKGLLGWVETYVQSSAAHANLCLNVTAEGFIFSVTEDAASAKSQDSEVPA